MGDYSRKAAGSDSALAEAEAELKQLTKSQEFELARAAVDAVGILDPTPTSDLISFGMSVAAGDWFGAGMSLISVVPYVGDAIGKTAKGAKLAVKLAQLRKRTAAVLAKIAKLRRDRKAGAALERARRRSEAAEKMVRSKTVQGCGPPPNPFGVSKLPKTGGEWKSAAGKPGQAGDSFWHPDPKNPRGREVLEATGGKPVRFKDGYPDFEPFIYKHKGKPAKVEIEMTGTKADFDAANDAMKKIDPKWEQPEGYTWHHKEDGATMELVPSNLNNRVPHDGGASIVSGSGSQF